MFDAQPKPAPSSSAVASGASAPLSLSNGSAPTATTATAMYRVVAMTSEPTMAMGRSLPGLRVSSPEVDTASNPM